MSLALLVGGVLLGLVAGGLLVVAWERYQDGERIRAHEVARLAMKREMDERLARQTDIADTHSRVVASHNTRLVELEQWRQHRRNRNGGRDD